jgi:hypothetical protein
MSNEKQQTAVEWLEETMLKPLIQWPDDIWEQAKEMEKEQKRIKLPSDEEISEESPYVPDDASIDFWSHKEGFVDGAKWMRNKIQGGNK